MSRLERLVSAIEKTERTVGLAQIRLRRLRYEARMEMKKRSDPKSLVLSRREAQVAELVREHSNKEIAAYLGVTVRTAKFHVSNLLKKYNARVRSELPF